MKSYTLKFLSTLGVLVILSFAQVKAEHIDLHQIDTNEPAFKMGYIVLSTQNQSSNTNAQLHIQDSDVFELKIPDSLLELAHDLENEEVVVSGLIRLEPIESPTKVLAYKQVLFVQRLQKK